jgi:glutaredoxin
MAVSGYTLYWQPGCTSCLRAREFLGQHRIEFESVNVRATPGAGERLAGLGARSVPVLARGSRWIHGQDLDEVARFLGVAIVRERLDTATLAARSVALLAAATRLTRQLPTPVLEGFLPGRSDRAGADLAAHVAMIVAGFLDAARGGTLAYEYFERRPAGADRAPERLIALQQAVRADFASWWGATRDALPATVETYYGRQPLAAVLERTAWHLAQHCRQLESLLRQSDLQPDGALTPAELGGLPLPEGVWDREVGAGEVG